MPARRKTKKILEPDHRLGPDTAQAGTKRVELLANCHDCTALDRGIRRLVNDLRSKGTYAFAGIGLAGRVGRGGDLSSHFGRLPESSHQLEWLMVQPSCRVLKNDAGSSQDLLKV